MRMTGIGLLGDEGIINPESQDEVWAFANLYDPRFVINDDDNEIINDTNKRSFLSTM
jgi:hypothetical protein